MHSIGEIDGFIGSQRVQQAIVLVDEFSLFFGRCNARKAFRFPILKPQSEQELYAAGMRVVPAKLSRDMCSDLYRRSTEPSVQPGAQRRFLGRCHAGLTTPPPVGGKRVPVADPVGLVPAANGVVVYVQKLCDSLAGLPVIKQQDRIGAPRNTVVFALTANAGLKLTAVGEGKKTRADHDLI